VTSLVRLTTSNFFQPNTCGFSSYVTSSLTREWGCRLPLLLVFARAVFFRSESLGTHDQILLSQIRDSPNLEGQVPVFICPRKREARLYAQKLGYIFVASYDGGIRPRLHTGFQDWITSKNYIKIQFVPHKKYITSPLQSYLVKESLFIVRTIRNTNLLRGQNAEFLFVKAGGTYSNHWILLCIIDAVLSLRGRNWNIKYYLE
jgi:hypothetical protein